MVSVFYATLPGAGLILVASVHETPRTYHRIVAAQVQALALNLQGVQSTETA